MEEETPPTTPETQRDFEYFTKLIAVLIILAAVWFGSRFFEEEEELSNIYGEDQAISASVLPDLEKGLLPQQADLIPPVRNWEVPELEFEAASVFAFDTETGKVLFEKNAQEPRSIASLSKLITALVVMENARLEDELIVSEKAVETSGKMGSLVANEKISVESLLSAMLIESSNDAAVALAENFSNSGQASFAELMNRKASQLNLEISRFSDPSGLSYENISSAAEVAKMIQSSAEYQILRELTTIEETDIRSTDGKYNHHLVNSNKLLKKYPEIIIGKTGYIDEAGQCIALAIKPPRGEGMIINVILGSPDRLFEMEKLILWEKKAFLW